jgi:flagellar hook assembly protein FlgD
VDLTLSATDSFGSVTEMQFSNDGSTWTTPEAYATSKSWTLTTGDGTKTIYAKFKDNAGNWMIVPCSSSITLDTTPPTGSIIINNGAAYTNSTTVDLTLSATDSYVSVTEMQFSNDGLSWTTPEAYATSKSWTINTGDGTKTIYAKFKDNAGNWMIVPCSNSITLDTTPPTVAITSPAAGDTSVTTPLLTYTVSDGTVVVKVDGVAVNKVSGENLDVLSFGPHTVQVEATDAANNTGFASVNFTVVDPAIVGLWHMDGDWRDSSGNNNTGVPVNGPTFSTDNHGGTQAVSLNGSNSFVEVADSNILDLTSAMTVEAWIKPNDIGNYRQIVSKFGSPGNYAYEIGLAPAGNLRVDISGNGTANDYLVTTTAPITVNVWNHIAATFNAGILKLYVNGIEVVQPKTSTISSLKASTSPINIGRAPAGIEYFSGLIDEVALYNRALTAVEIAGSVFRREALWHMDGNWTDASGNGNDGTPNAGAAFSTNAKIGSGSGSFNGLDSAVTSTVSSLPFGNGPRTVSAWVKPENGTQNRGIIQYGGESSGYFKLMIDELNRAVVGSDSNSITGLTSLADGQWHYVVGVYEGVGTTVVRLYVDSVLENSSIISPPETENGGFMIGTLFNDGGHFNGLIDELSIHDYSLGVNEIDKTYNEGLGRIGLWHMDGDWTDASQNGHSGTSNGATFSASRQLGTQSGSFDGVDDYVAAGGLVTSVSNTFTIAFWANATAARNSTSESYSSWGTGGQRYAIAPLWGAGSDAGAGVSVGNNGISVFELAPNYMPSLLVYDAPLSGWNHIVVIYENKQPKLYVNGQFVRAGLVSQRANVHPSMYFGDVAAYGRYQGLLDEVEIYNRALPPDEILYHYNNEKAPTVKIVSPQPGIISTATPTLTYLVNRGTVVVKVDGNVVSKVSGDTLGPLGTGLHTVRVEATDEAGKTGSDEVNFTFSTGPTVDISSPAAFITTRDTNPLLMYTVSEGTVVVKVDGNIVSKVSGDLLDTLDNESHSVRVEATDGSGITGVGEVHFTVDATIPFSLTAVNTNTHFLDTSLSETATVSFTINSHATVTFKIVPEKQGPAGMPIYQTSQVCASAGSYYFTWEGRKTGGTVVPDEAYLYIIEATDGTNTATYSPPALTGTGNISCSQDTYDPIVNDPMTINYMVSQPSRITIKIIAGQSASTIINAVPYEIGSYTYDWDGRDSSGNIISSGTVQCSVSSLLRDNYIITNGNAPKVSGLKTDPYAFDASYGQFTRIRYSLSIDADVTVQLSSPHGSTLTLLSNQHQTAGANEIEWTAIDSTDTTGKKLLFYEEGAYLVSIQAVNPATGASSTTRGTLTISQ